MVLWPQADLLRVFAGPVLRVARDQVGARKKFGVAAIFPQEVADAGRKRMGMRFVIARVDKGGAVGLESDSRR